MVEATLKPRNLAPTGLCGFFFCVYPGRPILFKSVPRPGLSNLAPLGLKRDFVALNSHETQTDLANSSRKFTDFRREKIRFL